MLKKFNINELTVNNINIDYGWVEFNSVKIYITNDKKMFKATKLFYSFKKGKLHFSVWIKLQVKHSMNRIERVLKKSKVMELKNIKDGM